VVKRRALAIAIAALITGIAYIKENKVAAIIKTQVVRRLMLIKNIVAVCNLNETNNGIIVSAQIYR
jgi:hypothetical protein